MLSTVQFLENPNGFLEGMRRLAFRNPLYTYTLSGKSPSRLLGTPPELRPGNAAAGQTLLAGAILHDGRRFPFRGFAEALDSFEFAETDFLHSFNWLSDLRRVGSAEARACAQQIMSEWVDLYGRWDDYAWRPDLLGARLSAWFTHFGFYGGEAEAGFNEKIFATLARQCRHLARVSDKKLSGAQRFKAIQGLIYAGVCLPESDQYLISGLDQLEQEISRQIAPDGGHCSRNPEIQVQVMTDIVTIRATLSAAHIDVPSWLQKAIEVMAPMLRALRHGDGGLALFNGAGAGDQAEIDSLLTVANIRGKALSSAPHSGFHRLTAGRTTIIMDTGSPPDADHNRWGHAGTLSFEMSVGKERLIVNCGPARHMGKDWQAALRASAAHSTVVVDDLNSAELNLQGGFYRQPKTINSSRREHEGDMIIDATADGYEPGLQLRHRRIVRLSSDGGHIFGEDRLIGSGGRAYAGRFHLHPNVQATLIQNGTAVLLKPRRGPGWKFSVPSGTLLLEDSIYLDGRNRHRRTQQIVLAGDLSGRGATVEWDLARI